MDKVYHLNSGQPNLQINMMSKNMP